MANKPTAEHRRHWDQVAALGCILTGAAAEIAHCHGGSIGLLGPDFQPGVAQRQNHWLVIPLAMRHHRGAFGLDTWGEGVLAWEHRWSTNQIRLLCQTNDRLDYCIFKKAGLDPALVYAFAAEPLLEWGEG